MSGGRKEFDEDGSLLKSLEQRLSSPRGQQKEIIENRSGQTTDFQQSQSPTSYLKASEVYRNGEGQTPQFQLAGADDTGAINSNQKRRNMLDELKSAMESYKEQLNQTIEEEKAEEELTSQPSAATMGIVDRGQSAATINQTMQSY